MYFLFPSIIIEIIFLLLKRLDYSGVVYWRGKQLKKWMS
jgi:hypothetical protein